MPKLFKQGWLYVLAALITLIGLITGKFFFLFLILPLGFNFFNKSKEEEDS